MLFVNIVVNFGTNLSQSQQRSPRYRQNMKAVFVLFIENMLDENFFCFNGTENDVLYSRKVYFSFSSGAR